MANTFGNDHETVKFMIDAFNREVEGLDDVEIWIHTCWGNPNMQRVMEDTSYAASIELYLERCKGDVWTVEMKDRELPGHRAVRAVQRRPEEEGRPSARSATARSRPTGPRTWPPRSAGR